MKVIPRCYVEYGIKMHALRRVEEQIDDVVAAFRVVEVDEETPVDEPGALLQ